MGVALHSRFPLLFQSKAGRQGIRQLACSAAHGYGSLQPTKTPENEELRRRREEKRRKGNLEVGNTIRESEI